jgi:hypothetical protein
VKEALKEISRKKTAEERKMQEKIKRIGKCPMNFDWIKCSGGYRCAGGSHFVSDNELSIT